MSVREKVAVLRRECTLCVGEKQSNKQVAEGRNKIILVFVLNKNLDKSKYINISIIKINTLNVKVFVNNPSPL